MAAEQRENILLRALMAGYDGERGRGVAVCMCKPRSVHITIIENSLEGE